MPYTLTSLGQYVAQHRARRTFTVSTALVTPDHFAKPDAVNRWTRSLEETHPEFHAQGKRAVALICDAQMVVVVPFDWVSRLPLRKPPTLQPVPTDTEETLFTQPEPEQPLHAPSPAIKSPYRRNETIAAESVRALYNEQSERLEWWEKTYPRHEIVLYEAVFSVTSDLAQMNAAYSNSGSRMVRKLLPSSEKPYWAIQHSREYNPTQSPLWIPEDIFQVFAQDRRDFNAHYTLLSMSTSRSLAIVDDASRLVLGVVNTDTDNKRQIAMA